MAVDDNEIEIPKWDVALANLAREEYDKKGEPLTMEDFTRLAKDYSIRLDDIMMTMFELVIHEHWAYEGAQEVNRQALNDLYINGRLHAQDLEAFTGNWSARIV